MITRGQVKGPFGDLVDSLIKERHAMTDKELKYLRTSIKRVAELTGDINIIRSIPDGIETNYEERGWNTLCGLLCDWVERHREHPPSLVPEGGDGR